MSHHHEPAGVVLHDERTDTLREDRTWHVTDPETGEKRVLRLRVARGVIGDVEQGEGVGPDATDLVAVASMVANRDWEGLIAWAKDHNRLPDRHGSDDPAGYEWQGDHETDARWVYPTRDRLVCACLEGALDLYDAKVAGP